MVIVICALLVHAVEMGQHQSDVTVRNRLVEVLEDLLNCDCPSVATTHVLGHLFDHIIGYEFVHINIAGFHVSCKVSENGGLRETSFLSDLHNGLALLVHLICDYPGLLFLLLLFILLLFLHRFKNRSFSLFGD